MSEVIKVIDNSILCGHRGEADQNEAFNEGKSRVRFPNSKHNSTPSMGIDTGPYDPKIRNVPYDDFEQLSFYAGIVMGIAFRLLVGGYISHSVRWGGDWDRDYQTNDERWRDLVHFELVDNSNE